MIDRKNGWAQTARAVLQTNDWRFPNELILRTTDGGRSWKSVLSAAPEQSLGSCFYDAKTAWVATAVGEDTNVTVFRTSNGGRSWAESSISQPSSIAGGTLSFPDSHTGWLMLIPDHGMNSEPGVLYETRDGGQHWHEISNTSNPRGWYHWEQADEPEFTNRHPFLVCGGAMTLRNDLTGWVLGSLASTTPRFLFITRDDGRNWQVQPLPFPPGYDAGRMEPLGLPEFFSPRGKEGILAAQFVPSDSLATNYATAIYQTHDGGLSWQATAPVKFINVMSFISARRGWVWSPEPHGSNSTAPVKGTLYRTVDGGMSWQPVRPVKALDEYLTHGQDVVQLDFVDEQCGWAIARDGHNFTQLLETHDGGKTWDSIQPGF